MSEINSVSSSFLSKMTDEEIVEAVSGPEGQAILNKVLARLPGVSIDSGTSLEGIPQIDFTIEKHPVAIFHHPEGLVNDDVKVSMSKLKVATVRTDTMTEVGSVGPDYTIVQNLDAFSALDVLQKRGDLEIVKCETIDHGARVRITALLGTSTFPSVNGAPNTLAHFAMFEATHNGSACCSVTVYTVRVECLNGMTSRDVVKVHKLSHTSRAYDRIDAYSEGILASLIGEAEAEAEMFKLLVNRPMNVAEFGEFAEALLGPIADDASKAKITRRDKAIDELTSIFLGGNEGAGYTLWGAANTATRWIEDKREALSDALAMQKRFTTNVVAGSGQSTIKKAYKLLTRY